MISIHVPRGGGVNTLRFETYVNVNPFTNLLDTRRVNLPAKSEVGDGNVVQDNAELLCPRGQLLKEKIKCHQQFYNRIRAVLLKKNTYSSLVVQFRHILDKGSYCYRSGSGINLSRSKRGALDIHCDPSSKVCLTKI
jgi:hypothetical protein